MTHSPLLGAGWRSLLVESLVVIASILLAFGIDAWWDRLRESERQEALRDGLLADFRASRESLEDRLSLARRMTSGNALFLGALDSAPVGSVVSVSDTLIYAVLGGPTYEPNTNTLDAAVASGELDLLDSQELRLELANWRRTLSDTAEDELEVRRITNEQVIPLLSQSVDLGERMGRVLTWSGVGGPGPAESAAGAGVGGPGPAESAAGAGAGGSTPVAVSTELIGALALRHFYAGFSASDLEELLRSLDRVVALLEGAEGR